MGWKNKMTKCQKCKGGEATCFFRLKQICPDCFRELHDEMIRKKLRNYQNRGKLKIK
jgi:hypothetical protein